jgi:hypothetical protein
MSSPEPPNRHQIPVFRFKKLDVLTRKLAESLLQQFVASLQDGAAPEFIARVEGFSDLVLCRVIQSAPAILVPAIFFAKNMKDTDPAVCAELLANE